MEKLWTTSEVARFLGIQDAQVDQLVRDGKLTGYKLGGQFLRFRPDQVKELQSQGAFAPQHARTVGRTLEWRHRLQDLWYFYDFYVLSFVLLAVLVIYLVSTS